MAAGHHQYADSNIKTDGLYPTNSNKNTIAFHMKDGVFKNSKKSKSKYQYTNLLTSIVINYVWHKSDGNFQDLLDKVFKEKVSRRDVFIGVIDFVATFGVVAGSSGTTEWDVTGDLVACAALFTWTAYFIISKQTQNRVSPLEFTAATGVITGILNFLISLVFSVALTLPSRRDIFWLFILATVAGLIGHSLMNWSLV